MSLETEVAALTTATTSLLSAVNVSKETLDESTATAVSSASTASTKAAEASTSAASAANSATNAATSATSASNSATSAANSAASAASITGSGNGIFNSTPISTASTLTLSGGTANGVAYLNGSKVLTTGSALTFDGTNLKVGSSFGGYESKLTVGAGSGPEAITVYSASTDNGSLYMAKGTTGADRYNGFLIYNHHSNSWLFGTSATERMRIDSSGNVLIGTTTAGASKLVVNSDSIQVNTAKTPASATATGTTGQIAWDANYIYVCVATNTWKRSAIATW